MRNYALKIKKAASWKPVSGFFGSNDFHFYAVITT